MFTALVPPTKVYKITNEPTTKAVILKSQLSTTLRMMAGAVLPCGWCGELLVARVINYGDKYKHDNRGVAA